MPFFDFSTLPSKLDTYLQVFSAACFENIFNNEKKRKYPGGTEDRPQLNDKANLHKLTDGGYRSRQGNPKYLKVAWGGCLRRTSGFFGYIGRHNNIY